MLKVMMTSDLVGDPVDDLDRDPFDDLEVDDLACYSEHLVGDPPDDLDGDPVDDLACYFDYDQLACQSSRQSSPAHPNRPWHNPGRKNNGNEQGNKEAGVIFEGEKSASTGKGKSTTKTDNLQEKTNTQHEH